MICQGVWTSVSRKRLRGDANRFVDLGGQRIGDRGSGRSGRLRRGGRLLRRRRRFASHRLRTKSQQIQGAQYRPTRLCIGASSRASSVCQSPERESLSVANSGVRSPRSRSSRLVAVVLPAIGPDRKREHCMVPTAFLNQPVARISPIETITPFFHRLAHRQPADFRRRWRNRLDLLGSSFRFLPKTNRPSIKGERKKGRSQWSIRECVANTAMGRIRSGKRP